MGIAAWRKSIASLTVMALLRSGKNVPARVRTTARVLVVVAKAAGYSAFHGLGQRGVPVILLAQVLQTPRVVAASLFLV